MEKLKMSAVKAIDATRGRRVKRMRCIDEYAVEIEFDNGARLTFRAEVDHDICFGLDLSVVSPEPDAEGWVE